MALQAFDVVPVLTPKGRVKKNQLKYLIPDESFLSETIRLVAATEIQQQIKLGNHPQNIIVDGQDTKPFNKADFRIVTLFPDTRTIAHAAHNVITELKKVTRHLTGAAKISYQVWVVDGRNDGGRLVNRQASMISRGQLEKIAEKLTPTGRIVIAGPMVDYGRKLYWNPKSGRDISKGRARYAAGYDVDTGRVQKVKISFNRDTNMRDLVIGRVKRRYPGTVIIGRWIESSMRFNGDNRWPGIAIGLKTKGKLK